MVDYWKDVPGIDEASGTYQGLLLSPKNVNAAFLLGMEIGSKNLKTGGVGTGDSGIKVFVKKEDLKKINKYVLLSQKSENGAFDFSIDKFIKSGIRGVV
jgi:hypothetical protein